MNLEQAQEIRQSILWDEFVKELESCIDKVKSQMEHCAVDQLRDLQKEIQIYRKVISLPQTVIDREE